MNFASGPLNLILWALALLVVGYVAFYIIDRAGIPAPFHWIVKLVVAVILLIVLLNVTGVVNIAALAVAPMVMLA